MKKPAKLIKAALRILLAIFIVALCCENYLYFTGYSIPQATNEAAHIDDSACGWLPKPGISYSREDPSALTTVTQDFMRISRPQDISKPCKAVILGCSYTFGMGVHDMRTYPWLLNEKCQSISFDNAGVIGYNTCQCLNRLNELYEQGRHYDLVFFGIIRDQLKRTANMRVFGKNAESSDFIGTPYAELINGNLVIHKTEKLDYPLSNRLLIMNFINKIHIKHLEDETRVKNETFNPDAAAIFLKLTGMMKDTAEKHGSKLILLFLDGVPEIDLNKIEADYYDISFPNIDEPQNRVAGRPGNHPNADVHAYWAEKLTGIAEKLQKSSASPDINAK
ncbi:MAG: hypothetical protein K6G50_07405 [bacterium]|nr:hypothetical protein [bacterium]